MENFSFCAVSILKYIFLYVSVYSNEISKTEVLIETRDVDMTCSKWIPTATKKICQYLGDIMQLKDGNIPSFSFSGILEQNSFTLKSVIDNNLVLGKGIEMREGKYYFKYRYK